jgi:DNA-binding CsgD family transcriptional regulator
MRQDLAGHAAAMQDAGTIREAAALLRRVGEVLSLPFIKVTDDYPAIHDVTDEAGTALSDLFGWDRFAAYIGEAEKSHYNVYHPAMRRARQEALPFVWPETSDPLPHSGKISETTHRLGIESGIVVPVRMPRGRLGIIGWGGARDAAELRDLLTRNTAALLEIGHFFFATVRRHFDPAWVEEDLALLTPREMQCLAYVAAGDPDREIARRVNISVHTVRAHVDSCVAKLAARNRTHAVALALQLGLIGEAI